MSKVRGCEHEPSNLDLLPGECGFMSKPTGWLSSSGGGGVPEEAEWNKGIYPQTLIIPNLEHRHKKGKNV